MRLHREASAAARPFWTCTRARQSMVRVAVSERPTASAISWPLNPSLLISRAARASGRSSARASTRSARPSRGDVADLRGILGSIKTRGGHDLRDAGDADVILRPRLTARFAPTRQSEARTLSGVRFARTSRGGAGTPPGGGPPRPRGRARADEERVDLVVVVGPCGDHGRVRDRCPDEPAASTASRGAMTGSTPGGTREPLACFKDRPPTATAGAIMRRRPCAMWAGASLPPHANDVT